MKTNDVNENYTKQVDRDNRLKEYCKSNNIILIEIDGRKYTDDKIKTYLQNTLPLKQFI